MLENFQRVDIEWIRSHIDYTTKTFTDPNGIIVSEIDMPDDVANTHGISVFGAPRRIQAHNPQDHRKFKVDAESYKIKQDENGDEGFIGYLDFYVGDNGDSNVGFTYLYPEYRGKGISREMTDYLEIITPEDAKLNVGDTKDEKIYYMSHKHNSENPGRVDYK